jgi:Xaa-Pro aminopeptidase
MRPLVLLSGGTGDSDFFYATGFQVENAAYIRFAGGDDLLVVPRLELERARETSRVAKVVDRDELGWEEMEDFGVAWSHVVARALRERGVSEVLVSPRLYVTYAEGLAAEGIATRVERRLFLDQRRRKSRDEAAAIQAAQHAAEAACSEVIAQLGVAEAVDGVLQLDRRPLTSERLFAEANAALNQIGYSTPEMIIAGAPVNAIPHARGSGPIRAGAPVIIDIFPRGNTSHYHGDLTRTVVVGEIGEEVRKMHAAVVAALEAAIEQIRPGVNGRDVHRTACRVLVEHGFGTTTAGYEGHQAGPIMTHSLGHGVGLDVHEAPYLRELDMPLAEGDVLTVEPGLYDRRLGGVRVEDTGIVTADGFRNFTSLSRALDPRAYL